MTRGKRFPSSRRPAIADTIPATNRVPETDSCPQQYTARHRRTALARDQGDHGETESSRSLGSWRDAVSAGCCRVRRTDRKDSEKNGAHRERAKFERIEGTFEEEIWERTRVAGCRVVPGDVSRGVGRAQSRLNRQPIRWIVAVRAGGASTPRAHHRRQAFRDWAEVVIDNRTGESGTTGPRACAWKQPTAHPWVDQRSLRRTISLRRLPSTCGTISPMCRDGHDGQ